MNKKLYDLMYHSERAKKEIRESIREQLKEDGLTSDNLSDEDIDNEIRKALWMNITEINIEK